MADAVDPACGCAIEDPLASVAIANQPGLPVVAHRIGTHSTFKRRLLASLSGQDVSALRGLGTRDDDDFSVGLIDAFAVMADVLTFYSERIANEAFLRTATERRSVLELARLIGYQLNPGLAADAWLAFTLDQAPPPTPPVPAVTIPAGTRVQSVPGPDEVPQTFETIAPIEARPELNAIAAQTDEPQATSFGQRELILAGTGHALTPGDVLLIVGDERSNVAESERWDARLLRSVSIDIGSDTTCVTWLEGLGSVMPRVNPAAENVRAFVFRQRAALFGHNAPDPRLLSLTPDAHAALVDNIDPGLWKDFGLARQRIDLDQSYPKVVPGSWIVLLSEEPPHETSSLPGYAELYQATTVGHQSVSAFGLASKVTRIGLDTSEHLALFSRRATLVLCQSEELPIARRPLRAPVVGGALAFAHLVPGLLPGQALAVTGAAQHLRVTEAGEGKTMALDDGTTAVFKLGDRLALLVAPTVDAGGGARVAIDPETLERQLNPVAPVARPSLRWRLADRDGRAGTLEAAADAFVLDPFVGPGPGLAPDPIYSEVVLVSSEADALTDDRDRTVVRLADDLARAYDRTSVLINANVAPATHGESVRELIGAGDASRANQHIPLRQKPVTFVGAETTSGHRSTLVVRVDGTQWLEQPTLVGAAANDRVFALNIADNGTAEVIFGDGVEGARPPTAGANVRAAYRKGIGKAGNVRAGQLSSLLVRPTGVSGATNPEPASGGVDPESLADARSNAPVTVLTLGRAVSRLDYVDFARTFAGIAKADAAWIPSGPNRGIVLSIAGPGGADLAPDGKVATRLAAALRAYGDPLLQIAIRSYRRPTFRLALTVKVDEAEVVDDVLTRVRRALEKGFGFAVRAFLQPVSADEVVALAHSVRGVIAVNITALRRVDQPSSPAVRDRLDALPSQLIGEGMVAAELLTIDPAVLELGPMP